MGRFVFATVWSFLALVFIWKVWSHELAMVVGLLAVYILLRGLFSSRQK
jgi:hypothetical protein